MVKPKLVAMNMLRRAKMFVVVTEEDTLMAADFGKSLEGFMMLDSIKKVYSRIGEIIKQEGSKANGRNQARRPTRRPKK